ncbi:cytochrome c biogenesis protein CcsA [Chengkuizengella axinellae]|uniref:Cytochrome c biogenesis protein CcsA n=1 Tax=Chengkuizengella axinellae TaxID=3064388 RepID=A0ABT9ITL3_9BACL|nr:cytochrome c biogenesis protein CcsA [Chengkuizengella sp. 2205SS18-9]MDP5272694.1 cytochrome c biogenesis protein CcsA [Chengkuizengella sp. 2205SS18-9]
MGSKTFIYDIIIYLYTLSLLFSFSDTIHKNRRAKWIGTGLLIIVWILQSNFFILRMLEHSYFPILTMFDTLFFFSWIVVTISLMLNIILKHELFVFAVNVAAFTIMVISFFSDSSALPTLQNWAIHDELLFIHITLAMSSYAFFLVSFILSCLYLILFRMLKEKKWFNYLKKLPSLEKIDRFAFFTVIIGLPLLLVSIILILIWMILTDHLSYLLDLKVLNSFLVLGAYIFYLIKKLKIHSPGNNLAFWNIIAFIILLINFIISNYLSDFHMWIWM